MKKTLLVLNSLILSYSALGGTDIIYKNGTSHTETVVAGNIYFETEGLVDARRVCFDKVERIYKTTIPQKVVETCSIAALPVWMCEQEGAHIVRTQVAARDLTAPEFVAVKTCTDWNRSDSTHPVCTRYENVEKAQPVDFKFMQYKVEIDRDYNGPKSVEIRTLSECK
jgi:hypothetical protein